MAPETETHRAHRVRLQSDAKNGRSGTQTLNAGPRAVVPSLSLGQGPRCLSVRCRIPSEMVEVGHKVFTLRESPR